MSKESRGITAFITERGKYIWNVIPQGLRDSSDHFLRITDDILHKGGLNLKNYVKNFDDILLAVKDLRTLAHSFQQLLEICRQSWMAKLFFFLTRCGSSKIL